MMEAIEPRRIANATSDTATRPPKIFATSTVCSR
jgi:hypothetical protein